MNFFLIFILFLFVYELLLPFHSNIENKTAPGRSGAVSIEKQEISNLD